MMFDTAMQTKLLLFSCCFVGCFTLYMLTRLDGRQPFSLMRVLNVDLSNESGKPLVILFDMVLSSSLGGWLVMMVAQPNTTVQGVIAGLGMTGLLAAHTTKARENG